MGAETLLLAAQAGSQVVGGISASRSEEWNASMAEFDAQFAGQQAKLEEGFRQEEGERELGAARAEIGASGLTGGTDERVLAEIRRNTEIDAALIRAQGAVSQWRSRAEATQAKTRGSEAFAAGGIKGATTLLKGLK